MNRDDYLEDEWPEESPAEPEAPAEEEESDRDLYAIDTAPSEEGGDAKGNESSEETDFLNAEDTAFRPINEHKLYQMEEPPRIEEAATTIGKAEICFQRYCRTKNKRYLDGFLHYYEPIINDTVSSFMQRYAMGGHFEDLKQEAVIGILEAADRYKYTKKTTFHKYVSRSIENRLHDYTRRMRRGCTVESDYAYDRLRKVMAVFNRLGGHGNLATLLAVSEETGISAYEAESMILAALQNMQCADIYRSYGTGDGEPEDSREEITISPYPEPYEALLIEYQAKALCLAWESLDYREQEMLAAHLGFCPECFSVLEQTGSSEKWYDCVPRKRTPYADIAISFGLSCSESAQRICEQVIKKLRDTLRCNNLLEENVPL